MSTLLGDQGGGSTTVRAHGRAEHVVLVFKTHLDLGFTALASEVEQAYLDHHIPTAIALARRLRDEGVAERFVWTTGSWLIERALERGDAGQRRALETAIAAGDLVWHALPFTTHTELLDAEAVRYGISIARRLDRRFGRRTIAAKMTDVPGHTAGLVPLLAEAGVEYLHIGVNPFSRVPQVPPLFRWCIDDADILVQYDAEDYGVTTLAPGCTTALAFAHTGDNAGPQDAAQVAAAWAHARAAFPGAAIRAGTLDDVAVALRTGRAALPVIAQDIGDTWIHGVGTAPGKVAGMRALARLRRTLPENAPLRAQINERLLLTAEHTWGLSRANLNDYQHYTPEQTAKLRLTERGQRAEASWCEQESYVSGVRDLARETPWHDAVSAALDATQPPTAPSVGTSVDPREPIEYGNMRLTLDATNGAIAHLIDTSSGRTWAEAEHPLGRVRYEQFSVARCAAYVAAYGRHTPATLRWGPISFARPAFDPDDRIRDRTWLPRVERVLRHDDEQGLHLTVETTFDDEAVRDAGAPRRVILAWTLGHDGRIALDLRWHERQASRLPDALWCDFCPSATPASGWQLHKLGRWMDPRDVIAGGGRRLHAIDRGIRWHHAGETLELSSWDAALVAPGCAALCDGSDAIPDAGQGWAFNLWNNWWNTNFPYWSDADARFRFHLNFMR